MPLILKILKDRGDGLIVHHEGEALDIEIESVPDNKRAVRLIITGPDTFWVKTFKRRNADGGEAAGTRRPA